MKVADIGTSLPSASRSVHRPKAAAAQQPMPKSLPECFAEVWRRRKSTLPAHRRERATLEAVAATIPSEASSLTGPAAAAAYLAALIVSLQRLVQTTNLVRPIERTHDEIDPNTLSKKKRKMLRRQQLHAEQDVKDMTTADVLRPMMKSNDKETMNIDDEKAGNNEDEGEHSDAQLIASLMYLISSAIGGSSTAVLQTKGTQILDVVVRAMNHVSSYGPAARHASTCICQMFSVLDASAWAKPVIQRSYLYLIRLTMERDAKSRKKAREALHQLFCGPRLNLIRSKTSNAAAAHYIAELKAHTLALDDETNFPNKSLPATLVHALTSIEQFAVFLQPSDAAKVAKELVLVATKHSQNVASFALLAMWSLMKHRTDEGESESVAQETTIFLPSKDIAKLLTALLRIEVPEDSSYEWRIAYCSCVADGAIAYAKNFTHTPPPLDFILKPVSKLCESLRLGSLERHMVRSLTVLLQRLLSQRWFMKRPAIFKMLEEFIDDRYSDLRNNTTLVLKEYLEQELSAGGLQVEDAVISLIKSLLSKRHCARNDGDRKIEGMTESLLSSVIRGGGAGNLLSVIKVGYNSDEHVSNAWVLPILINNLRGAPLSLFFEQFLPLTEKLKQAQRSCEKQKRLVEAKNIGMCLGQVWNLLPGFCSFPPDLAQEGLLSETFKSIHLRITTTGDNNMVKIGAEALRRLSVSIREVSATNPAMKQIPPSFASRLQKLYPAVSEAAERVPDERRLPLLQAVTSSCQASGNPQVVSSLLKITIRRLLRLQLSQTNGARQSTSMTDSDSSSVSQSMHAAADLAIAIVESKTLPPDATELNFLEKAISPFLTDPKESALQKKAYRFAGLLVSLREGQNVSSELSEFAKRVAEQSKTVAPGAKALRQGLVLALIEKHVKLEKVDEKTSYLSSINDGFLAEIVLGTRDSSEKARAASFSTLVSLARAWNVSLAGNDMAGLQRFLMAVAAGLAGKTVSMLAATLTSIGRLIYDFRGEATMSDDLSKCIDPLFATLRSEGDDEAMSFDQQGETGDAQGGAVVEPGPIAILLRHNAVEVQKAALGVIKVATKALSQPPTEKRLNDILPGIIPGLVHVAARSKKQETRLRVRVILERLLRKCGREALECHFPPEHAKLLAAVRKKYSREMLRKHAEKENRAKQIGSSRTASGFAQDTDAMSDDGDSDLNSLDSDIEREILDGDSLLTKKPSESKPNPESDADATNASGAKRNAGARNEEGIRYTDDGKPIFVESDAESGDAEVGSDFDEESDDSDEPPDKSEKPTQSRKRKGSHSHDAADRGKKMKGFFGEEYRGKRGRGDVKRPGRPDPYAYVPLGQNMIGKGSRTGRSSSRRNKQESSLHRLAGQVGTKKRLRKLGVPGRR